MKYEVKDGKVSLHIEGEYTADELAQLVAQIGEARSQIAADPDAPGRGTPIHIAKNSRYWTIYSAEMGGSLLTFRNQSLGWTGIVLPVVEVANLIGYLAGHLATATTSAQSGEGAERHDPEGSGGVLH